MDILIDDGLESIGILILYAPIHREPHVSLRHLQQLIAEVSDQITAGGEDAIQAGRSLGAHVAVSPLQWWHLQPFPKHTRRYEAIGVTVRVSPPEMALPLVNRLYNDT